MPFGRCNCTGFFLSAFSEAVRQLHKSAAPLMVQRFARLLATRAFCIFPLDPRQFSLL